mmetsp:Transcript_26226/g.60535  ORF Transcript_26226/g.60535 Transcript_26226/m.60535 type:complete len:218 (-) Transcript_26226:606-1259(-)
MCVGLLAGVPGAMAIAPAPPGVEGILEGSPGLPPGVDGILPCPASAGVLVPATAGVPGVRPGTGVPGKCGRAGVPGQGLGVPGIWFMKPEGVCGTLCITSVLPLIGALGVTKPEVEYGVRIPPGTGVRHPTVGVPGIIAGVPGITGVVVPSDKYLGCSGVGGQPAFAVAPQEPRLCARGVRTPAPNGVLAGVRFPAGVSVPGSKLASPTPSAKSSSG